MRKHPRDSNQVRHPGPLFLRKHVRFVASAGPSGERLKRHRILNHQEGRLWTHTPDPYRKSGMR